MLRVFRILRLLGRRVGGRFQGIATALLISIARRMGVAVRSQPITYKNGVLHPQVRRHQELVDSILSAGVPRDGAVLDVGCGRGWLSEALYNSGFRHIEGCDWRPREKLSQSAQQKLKYSRVNLNVEGLSSYTDRSFGLVVCSDVLEHLENPALMLRELERVLEPRGHVFISIPNSFNLFERWRILRTGNSRRYMRTPPELGFGHIGMLPLHILQSLCDRADLEIVRREPGYCLWRGHFWLPHRRLSHMFSYVASFHLMRKADIAESGSQVSVS